MKARWAYFFLFALVLGWLVSRPSGPSFMRLPGAGFPAPRWTMTNLLGEAVSSESLAGRVVVLNFWATWCPPCRKEIPELKAFQKSHDTNRVVIVGASTDEGGAMVLRPFVTRQAIDYPVVLAGLEAQQNFAVSQLPMTVVIDRGGRIAARYIGALTAAELERAVAPLLSESKSSPAATP